MAIMRRTRSLIEQPRRSATPCSVTTSPVSLRGVLTGPFNFDTMRVDAYSPEPTAEPRATMANPPRERFAARTKSTAPPTAPT